MHVCRPGDGGRGGSIATPLIPPTPPPPPGDSGHSEVPPTIRRQPACPEAPTGLYTPLINNTQPPLPSP
ncbi:hypothetical protein E2C01_024335 [Portunus trituberculatus]|uniref:Uncharacterized protein n=1 Tax=Portunus trituberculatus TaxID=210409 RepID=A0A5B7EC07_PORTR|nr:hypothetical protein [Portunus trituberculatus]